MPDTPLMDSQVSFQPTTSTRLSLGERRSPKHAGAFFPQAKNFVIKGGEFTSITHIHRSSTRSLDFRVIPLGDLYLCRELGPSASGHVRRMYSSQIHGSNSRMTAVLYEGDSAEERWREDVSRYSTIRHPNILQLLGVVSSGLHAAVFHDDLIPYRELLLQYRKHSHFSTVHFWACMETEFRDANQYVLSLSGRPLHWTEYTVWIRPSTRRLCLDLTSARYYVPLYLTSVSARQLGSLDPPRDSEIINLLSHNDYHDICYWHLCRFHQFSISREISVTLGSISYLRGPNYEASLKIAFAPNLKINDSGWCTMDLVIGQVWNPIHMDKRGAVIMENGWIRLNCDEIEVEYRRRICVDPSSARSWLAHANHIFNYLGVTSDLEGYFLVDVIHYWLRIWGPIDNDQGGYLFLCPLEDLQPDMPGVFRSPAYPAYWSFDPSGIERLCPADAFALGFPAINVSVELWGKYWNSSVYAGISRFHEVKQFDPSQQEASRDYPNYHLCCDREALLVHNGTQASNPGHLQADGVSESLAMGETRYSVYTARHLDTIISSGSNHGRAEGDSINLPVKGLTGANSAPNVPSGNLEEAQIEPSSNFKVMYVQFMLIIINSLFLLYHYVG